MKQYRVRITRSAERAILEHARFIADEGQSPATAKRWLERIWEAADRLRSLPRSAALAEEDRLVDYEVRRVVVGNHFCCSRLTTSRNGCS
jgi:plasmid stabilization system protein ParE